MAMRLGRSNQRVSRNISRLQVYWDNFPSMTVERVSTQIKTNKREEKEGLEGLVRRQSVSDKILVSDSVSFVRLVMTKLTLTFCVRPRG